MPTFHSNPLNQSAVNRAIRRYPALFGVPFVLLVVGASFGLKTFTQTRYDLQSQRASALTKEEELDLSKRKKKFDKREAYYQLEAAADEDWEPKRIERPKGLPDWGVPPSSPPAQKA